MILLKIILQKLAIITTEVQKLDFLQQWIEFNVEKVVVKILQGKCSYTNHARWAAYASSGCKFPVVYMCQKLWKLDDSRQTYCKKIIWLTFFGPPCICY